MTDCNLFDKLPLQNFNEKRKGLAMSDNDSGIHPGLLAKFRVIQNIFFEQWRQVPLYTFPNFSSFAEPTIENPYSNTIKAPASGNGSLKDLVNTDESGGDDGSGGGSMKGLRVEKEPPKLKMF